MNTLKHFYLFLVLLFSFTFISCNEDDSIGEEKTNTEVLTAGIWTGNRALSDGKDVTESWKSDWDISKYSMKFSEDGTYTYTYDGNAQQGIWRFTRGEQYIKFNNAEEVQVSVLEAQKLNLIYDRQSGIAEELRFVR
jgi:hypothetical protein